ncbi:hypothetical protein LCGC14_1760280 [marine sediment metagenome]|uniref:Uncharacterized protein n=1 Tax=marine sediment metagenome TaxID=412755 RepID=A0A0F9H1B4_9ZZZZ
MSCPPGNCSAWGAFRLCKLLPPIIIDGSYTPEELQMLWFCWRARSTGEYGGNTPVDLGFNTPGLIDISGKTNMAKIIEYCESRGTLVRQFTNFSRFGVKFNLPNFKAAGSFSSWSGGIFGGATSPGGGGGSSGGSGGGVDDGTTAPDPTGTGGGGGGGAATCPCIPDIDPGPPEVDLLTVVVCTEFDCDDEDPKLELTACGGTPPYSWTLTAGDGVQSGTSNRNVKVTPRATTNNFAGTEAYRKCSRATGVGAPTSCNGNGVDKAQKFDCDGEVIECTNPGTDGIGCCDTSSALCCDGLASGVGECDDADLKPACVVLPVCSEGPCGGGTTFCIKDVRTAEMVVDDCQPCTVQMDGAQITVTDDVSAQVVTTINTG